MDQQSSFQSNAVNHGWRSRIGVLLRSHVFLLTLLAGQFALVQLVTGPQYGDATRNMHWGVLTAENSAFLLGAPDVNERIKGFTPDPPSLAPRGETGAPQSGLHPWWGPVAPIVFALVWAVTHSYTALALVSPLAGAGVVVLTYWMGALWLSRREALIAAAFLACFPLFRDYATVAYTESLSALAVIAALLMYARGRTVATLLLGSIAVLMKLDVLLLYFGTIGAVVVWRVLTKYRGDDRGAASIFFSWRHTLISLVVPAAAVLPWIWFHYLNRGQAASSGGLSLSQFRLVAPQLLELLFYIPWYGALLTLVAIGAVCFVAIRHRAFSPETLVFLLAWFGLGFLVLLVYAATPGAGNSPRVIIPALPPLALLFAAGFTRLGVAWRRRAAFYLVTLFVLINLVTIGYYAIEGARLRGYEPVWRVLRERERGYVLTEMYWPTILYARQPATWFEADEVFQRNIMQHADNFAGYIGRNPIRYVVLPARGDMLASPDVRAYLDAHAERISAGDYLVYVIRR